MFTNKTRDYLRPQQSFFFAQARRKRRYQRIRRLLFIMITGCLVLLLMLFTRQAMGAQGENVSLLTNSYVNSPTLVFNHPDPKLRYASAVDTQIDVEVNGLIAIAEFKQVFVNPHGLTLDGLYQFPLPEDAAIHYLHMRIGEREIEGLILPKPKARQLFNQAKVQGKKASLVNQHRPNLFTNELANIPADSTVEITIRLMMPITIDNDEYSLRLPSAITQRYQPLYQTRQLASNGKRETLQQFPAVNHDRRRVGDNAENGELSRSFVSDHSNSVSPTYSIDNTYGHHQLDSKLAINVHLNTGVELSNISSISHPVIVLAPDYGEYKIQLADVEVPADRSFELTWQLAEINDAQVATYHEQVGDEHFTLLTLYPPQFPQTNSHTSNSNTERNQFARDMIFIIDTSGSMQGASIAQAKASLQHALKQLTPADSFNILAFDSHVSRLFSHTQVATPKNIARAKRFVSQLRADGGTEMYQPLSQALVMRRASGLEANSEGTSGLGSRAVESRALRQIVFITDGAVTNELELMQLLSQSTQDYRLYTIGIGAAPNGYFMKKAAQFGRGHYVFIQQQQEVLEKMTDLLDIISKPQLTNLELSFDNAIHADLEVYPKRLSDLHAGQPLQVAIKSSLPLTSFEVTGQTPQGDWYRSVVLDKSEHSKTLSAKTMSAKTMSAEAMNSKITDFQAKPNKNARENGVAKLWARRKIADLLDGLVTGKPKAQIKHEVTTTSLAYQILSPYTSLLAVEKPPVAPEPTAKTMLAGKHGEKHSDIRKTLTNSRLAVQESLQLMMPQTSLGWLSQFALAFLLIILALVIFRLRHPLGAIRSSRHA